MRPSFVERLVYEVSEAAACGSCIAAILRWILSASV